MARQTVFDERYFLLSFTRLTPVGQEFAVFFFPVS